MANLYLIAGCNGAGKSIFAPSILDPSIVSFDYDNCYLKYYRRFQLSEFQHEMALNSATSEFESCIIQAIESNCDFCYETNFDHNPVHWPNLFKKNGYTLCMIFFCLDNLDIAKERVQIRIQSNGHFVPSDTIDFKWKEGYKNLNIYFPLFDQILFFDNSVYKRFPVPIFQIINGVLSPNNEHIHIPDYFRRRLPDLFSMYDLGRN